MMRLFMYASEPVGVLIPLVMHRLNWWFLMRLFRYAPELVGVLIPLLMHRLNWCHNASVHVCI